MALATANFWFFWSRGRRSGSPFGRASVAVLLLAATFHLHGQTNLPPASRLSTEADFAAYAKTNFTAAEARYNKRNRSTEDTWQFARACFDLGEYATNNTERAEIAQRGIAVARQAIASEANSAPAHYYLAMNLGQLARTKGLGALKLVSEMEREFTLAHDIDEHFDYAGPDRNLGMLYRDAPSFGSIGSRRKARQHLQRACELAPEYTENRLALIEAYLKWGDKTDAHREFSTLEQSLPKARSTLTGDAWAASWADWETRIKAVKKRLEEASKAGGTPRQKD